MKLKYYLRGLGIGIIVTTLISSIANGISGHNLTTEQIIQKAQEFGMVSQDDYNSVQNDLSQAKKNLTDLQSQVTQEAEKPDQQQDNQKEEKKEESEKTTNPTNSDNDNVTSKETFIEGKTSESTTVKFNITPGMDAGTVAKLLQEKGIITDAAEFKDYIVKKEKTGNLRIGEYEVKSGDSYDTIIGKFTGK